MSVLIAFCVLRACDNVFACVRSIFESARRICTAYFYVCAVRLMSAITTQRGCRRSSSSETISPPTKTTTRRTRTQASESTSEKSTMFHVFPDRMYCTRKACSHIKSCMFYNKIVYVLQYMLRSVMFGHEYVVNVYRAKSNERKHTIHLCVLSMTFFCMRSERPESSTYGQ